MNNLSFSNNNHTTKVVNRRLLYTSAALKAWKMYTSLIEKDYIYLTRKNGKKICLWVRRESRYLCMYSFNRQKPFPAKDFSLTVAFLWLQKSFTWWNSRTVTILIITLAWNLKIESILVLVTLISFSWRLRLWTCFWTSSRL